MIKVNIPGRGDYVIEKLLLDYNGTIALDGTLLPMDTDVFMKRWEWIFWIPIF